MSVRRSLAPLLAAALVFLSACARRAAAPAPETAASPAPKPGKSVTVVRGERPVSTTPCATTPCRSRRRPRTRASRGVPRGVEHRPVAGEEVHVLLFEPASTLNTGDAGGPLTKRELDRI